MKKTTTILTMALVGGLFSCQSAIAETSLGLGVGMAPDYEGSSDYQAVPMLYGRYSYGDGKYLLLKGTQLKWNLLSENIQLGPLLQYRPERDDVDNNQVDRMKDVDAAVEAGFFLTGKFGPWSATLEFAADTTDKHDGYLVTVGGDYQAKISEDLKMTFGASTTYASDNYLKTYFSVAPNNRGTSTLPDHRTGSGELKDVGLTVATTYDLNDSWSIMGNLGYKRLLGDAKDSPIVDDEGDENQLFVGVMGVYHF
ncbi:MAG: MipA/OmpV family protein [Desulfobulbaceae bacterium]|nr:MipA/OmpV family protein [Desulfobulbaceae bacterium]